MSDEQRGPKTERIPVKGVEELYTTIRSVLSLPRVTGMSVGQHDGGVAVEVTREVVEGEKVMPPIELDLMLGPDYLLDRVNLEPLAAPAEELAESIMLACCELEAANLMPHTLFVSDRFHFVALMGMPEGAQGYVGLRLKSGLPTEDKIVVVGGPSRFLMDSTHGMIIDLPIEATHG